MTSGIISGFSAAAIPGQAGAASAESGPAGLFAALLSLLGQAKPEIAAPDAPALPDGLPAQLLDLLQKPDAPTSPSGDLPAALFNLLEKPAGTALETLVEKLDLPEMETSLTDLVAPLLAALPSLPADAAEAPPLEQLSRLVDGIASLFGLQPEALTAAGTENNASAEAESSQPQGPLTKLVERLQTLATTLQTAAPTLAEKLTALASQLQTMPLPAELLERLGLADMDALPDQLRQTVEALTTPRPAAKDAPQPQPFAVPSLKLPIAGALAEESAEAPAPRPIAHNSDGEPTLPEPTKPQPERPVADSRIRIEPQTAPAASPAPAATPDQTALPQQSAVPATPPAEARAVQVAYQTAAPPLNVPQVAFEIARQFQSGNSRFQIRLDPAELGRIDVKLDIDRHGAVSARLAVDRPETLDLLQRDQRVLERALAQAGLDANKTSLEFSLRQQADGSAGGDARQQPRFTSGGAPATEAAAEPAMPVTTLYRATASAGGVNLFV